MNKNKTNYVLKVFQQIIIKVLSNLFIRDSNKGKKPISSLGFYLLLTLCLDNLMIY